MPPRNSPWIWAILWFSALAIRLCGAFVLPNAEQDGYSYVEIIARLSAHFGAGQFHITDLYGFWLPLFQLAAAIPNVWIDNPLLVAKILSSLSGAISCVLVFAITQNLTRNFVLACAMFALLLCNPLHILYSAAAMTDVPHGCLVLASLWFILQQRWIFAAVLAALAEGVRIEAWILLAVIPLIQFLCQRRVSFIALSILFAPPLLWLGISYFATGDSFAYFAERMQYQTKYLDFFPSRHGFTAADIRQDLDYFLLGANGVVVFGIAAAAGLSIFHFVKRAKCFCWRAASLVAVALGFFAFLFVGYVSKRQPVILPRYGLTLFAVGLPLFAWVLQQLLDNWPRHPLPKITVVIALLFCFEQSRYQLPNIPKVLADFKAQRQICDALTTALQQTPDDTSRCFSDDVAVRVLSHLPPDRFVHSHLTPLSAGHSAQTFETYLREQHVAYLVFMNVEDSLPAKVYPHLRDKIGMENFQLVATAFSPFGPDVSLYRLRNF